MGFRSLAIACIILLSSQADPCTYPLLASLTSIILSSHCLITCNRCSSPSSDAATRFNPETDSTQVCACDAPPVVLIPPAHLARLRLLPATTSASRTSLVPVLASTPSTHTSPSAHGLQAPAPPSHSPVPRRFLPLSATPCAPCPSRPSHPAPCPSATPVPTSMHALYRHQPQLSLPAALCHRTLSSAGPQHRSGHLPTPPSHLPLASRPQALPSYPMLEPCYASASRWSASRRAAALCRWG